MYIRRTKNLTFVFRYKKKNDSYTGTHIHSTDKHIRIYVNTDTQIYVGIKIIKVGSVGMRGCVWGFYV